MTNGLQVKPRVSIQSLVHNEDFVKKANDVLGKGTRQFMSSVLSLCNSDKNLQSCDPIKPVSYTHLTLPTKLEV